MDVEEFDSEKFKLGSLCKREHDWGGTGKSLREIKKGVCAECNKEHKRKHYEKSRSDPEWVEEHKRICREKKREEYKRDPEKFRKISRNYALNHKDKISQRAKQKRRDDPKYAAHRNQQTENWRERNRERAREYSRLYYLRHIERYRENDKKRYHGNKEYFRLKASRYIKTFEGKISIKKANFKRRIHEKQNHLVRYKPQDVEKRHEDFNNSCAYCGSVQKITLDHFIPISKGGPDCIGNLIPACYSCNVSKSNHDPVTWYKAQPFFKPSRLRKILKVLGKKMEEVGQLPLF